MRKGRIVLAFRAILHYREKMGNRILKISNVKKTIHYLRRNGLRHAFYAAKERIEEEKKTNYVYKEPEEERLAAQRAENFPYCFSIVVPAYETKEQYLRELLESVIRQSYQRWELVITDAGKSDLVKEVVAAYQEKEGKNRIRYLRLPENGGISENTNAGIGISSGDYIGLLDHDDVLTPNALYEMAKAIYAAETEEKKKTPVLLYSDEDKFENNGSYRTPHIKEKFNFDLILSNNYICHFMMVRADYMKKLKLRKKYDGAQDYDLVLRIIERLLHSVPVSGLADSILHIPAVLYHWRCHEQSTADNVASKLYAYEAGKAALEDFCRARGWNVKVSHSLHLGFYQITYEPDMLTVRQDVGIVGGRILNGHHKIMSGIYDEEGNRLYRGLHEEYSGGSTHRAALMQNCAAVDIRCMRLCGQMRPVFEEITGVPYVETGKQKLADVSGIACDEAGYGKLSMELGRAAREKGFLVVWNPRMTIKIN